MEKLLKIFLLLTRLTWLSDNKDNAILVFHALTGDQFVTNINPITTKKVVATAVGPGKAIDTNKYFVICANVIGGCMVLRAKKY